MVAGVIYFLLKEKKLIGCLFLFLFGLVFFLLTFILDYHFPFCGAIVIDNNNKNIIFIKYKKLVPLSSKKMLKNEEIKSINIVTNRKMIQFGYYGFNVTVTRTNDEKFTGLSHWDEKDRKNMYEFLRLYLGKVTNSY